MTIAATISLPSITGAGRRNLTSVHISGDSFCRFSATVRPNILKFAVNSSSFRHPCAFRMSAAAAAATSPVSIEFPASFLDHKETVILHFVKYQGLDNDFILVDNRDSMEPKVTPEQAVKVCDRNFGIGADGVIFVMPDINGTDYTMRIFNSDGSEPEGNHSFTVHTGAGLIVPEVQDGGKVGVDMGEPFLNASDVPTKLQPNKDQSVVKSKLKVDGTTWNVTCVGMGNPHCVTFGTDMNQNLQVDELNLAEIGPKFEHHAMFPARTNTEFVQVFSSTHLKMRVWERGAGATLACGTGACAVVVAAVLEGHAGRSCTVDLAGGPLDMEWREEDNHIYMTAQLRLYFMDQFPYSPSDVPT